MSLLIDHLILCLAVICVNDFVEYASPNERKFQNYENYEQLSSYVSIYFNLFVSNVTFHQSYEDVSELLGILWYLKNLIVMLQNILWLFGI